MSIPKTYLVILVRFGGGDWLEQSNSESKTVVRKASSRRTAEANARKEFPDWGVSVTRQSTQRKVDKQLRSEGKRRPKFPFKADQRTYQYIHKGRKKPSRKNYPPPRRGQRWRQAVYGAFFQKTVRRVIPMLVEAPTGFQALDDTATLFSALKNLIVQPRTGPIKTLPILNAITRPAER